MRKQTKAVLLALAMALFFPYRLHKGQGRHNSPIRHRKPVYRATGRRNEGIRPHRRGTVYLFKPQDEGKERRPGADHTRGDHDNISIQTVHGLIIVTSKATGETIYIK